MTDRGPLLSVSGRFTGTEHANRATRALQKELGLRPGAVSSVLAPGAVPNLGGARDGYMGITKVGGILVHARARDAGMIERITALMERLGGEILTHEGVTGATGGYGPTTAHGRATVIGGDSTTSTMAPHRFTEEDPKEETAAEG